MSDNDKKKTTRKVARKTIVMQMEVVAYDDTWKDMTIGDFGHKPEDCLVETDLKLVQQFKDTAEAKRRLKEALVSGKLESGTFRVAHHSESFTPTVVPKQTNEVSF